MKQPAFCRK